MLRPGQVVSTAPETFGDATVITFLLEFCYLDANNPFADFNDIQATTST